jgi:hypothetical protein
MFLYLIRNDIFLLGRFRNLIWFLLDINLQWFLLHMFLCLLRILNRSSFRCLFHLLNSCWYFLFFITRLLLFGFFLQLLLFFITLLIKFLLRFPRFTLLLRLCFLTFLLVCLWLFFLFLLRLLLLIFLNLFRFITHFFIIFKSIFSKYSLINFNS